MKRALVTGLMLSIMMLSVAPAVSAVPSCSDQLQQALMDARSDASAQRKSDQALYEQFYVCLGRSVTEARGLAALRVQLAQAGESYAARTLKPATYRAFLIDRQRKAERMRRSPAYAEAVGKDDSDGDLVPDPEDKCPNTAPLAATDAQGCDLICPFAGQASRSADPACVAASPPNSAEDPLGPLLEASVPVNLSCEDLTPAASAPIAWGPRRVSIFSGRPPPFATIDSTSGYYFRVRRTNQQADGCETWYAVQFTFRNPISAGLPPLDIVSVLFSSAEDEDKNDPAIARFPMMTHQSRLEGDLLTLSVDLPLSPGRQRLRDNLFRYEEVSMRVRVVTGAQQASPWSPSTVKPQSPLIGD